MNRRDFFQTLALAAVAARLNPAQLLRADDSVPLDDNIVAIFSDPHLHYPETCQHVVRFNRAVAKVLAMNPRPAKLLIYGDISYDHGEIKDYELFRKLVQPLEAAGVKWEIAMGNHDRLPVYRKIFPERFEKPQPIEGRYINIVETPNADFILLDSYLEGQVRGSIAPEQREWLVKTLEERKAKPVFVGCHHPLKETGLADVFKACPNFAAFLHGHNHVYRTEIQEELQTVCFPSVGHWGDLGFTIANLTKTDATFVPDIDAYQWSLYSGVKEPIKDVREYIKQLNSNSLTVAFK